MNARLSVGIVGLALPMLSAVAQRAPETGCPIGNGLLIQTSTDSTGASLHDVPGALRIDADRVIDTVWTFNIIERRWTRRYFMALVGAGFASSQTGDGITTAPDSSAARAWRACAGARIDMRDPTLVLRGARGQVHLRADVRSLSRMGRRSSDTTSQPRR